jgi:hypothetical protein
MTSPALIEGICVIDLQYPLQFSRKAESKQFVPPTLPEPTFSLVLPDGYASRVEAAVPQFCFPDIELIRRSPYTRDDSLADEYVFVISSVQKSSTLAQQGSAPAPKALKSLYGFCKRYRIGGNSVNGRLDLPTFNSNDLAENGDNVNVEQSSTPSFQVICILSERPYHRFFSHCLQLLHASRLVSGITMEELARKLIAFSTAPPGSVIPLRSLATTSKSIPGSLGLVRERLRLPLNIGLELFDVPLSPLLTRLDPQSILLLYSAMLCERRILFVSNSISVLSSSVHAALALLQPFKWQNICIPLIPSKLLDRCCAPMPYIIGLTTEQFTSINDEYELGEIVLVSLDEGYIVSLNGSLPLVDFDGANISNGNTGTISYSCPKVSSETASARASVLSGSHGMGFSVSSLSSSSSSSSYSSSSLSSSFSSTMTLSSSSANLSNISHEPVSDLTNALSSARIDDASSQYSIGRRDGAALASIGRREASGLAASASLIANSISSVPPASGGSSSSDSARAIAANAAIDSVLSPFHSINRSHSYDEEVVLARAHRLAFVNRRLRTRRALNEKIAMLYHRPVKRSVVVGESGVGGGGGEWKGTTILAVETKAASSLTNRIGGGGGGGGGDKDKRGALKGLFDEFVDTEVLDVSHEEEDEASSIASVRTSLGLADAASFASDHAEAGTTNLAIDIHNLTSGRIGARRRPPPRKSVPSSSSSNSSTSSALSPSGSGASASMTLSQSIMSATKIGIALATGAPTSDCPAAKLSYELRNIYTRERKEGFYDEAAVYANFFAFVAIVFGGANSFVTVEGNSEEELVRVLSIANPTAADKRLAEDLYLKLHPRFSKEDFVRLSSFKHATITKLLDEAMHSQVVYAFICDFYVHAIELRAAAAVATITGGNSLTSTGVLVNGKVNIVDIALSEALLRHTKHGSFGKRSSAVSTNGVATMGSASSMAQLVSEPPPYSVVYKRLQTALMELYEPIADGSVAQGGSNGGVCGSGHSVSSALSSLAYSSTCVTASFAKPPQALLSAATGGIGESHPVLIVTALRALVNGMTLAGWKIEEPMVNQFNNTFSSSSSLSLSSSLSSSSSSSGSAHSSLASSSTSSTPVGTSAISSSGSILSTPLPTALVPSNTSMMTSSHAMRLLCTATFDPHLIHIVLGSLWARLNDASSSSSDASRHWQQRFKALGVLICLLKFGSARVMSISGAAFLPLLKFFMFPTRPFAVKAGYSAEKLSANTDTYLLSQSANVFSKSFPTRYSTSSLVMIPGLLLCPEKHVSFSQEALREGAYLVAQRAATAYLLIVSPRRWLVERAVALGPGGTVSKGLPLSLPLPFPLVNAAAALSQSSESLPHGWAPTLQQPCLPIINAMAVMGDGPLGIQVHGDVNAHPAFPLFHYNAFSPSVSAKLLSENVSMPSSTPPTSPPLEKQPRAALAAFDVVHKRAAPPMASSKSAALETFASGFTIKEKKWVQDNYRPKYVRTQVSQMKAKAEETILAAREQKVKTALFKSLAEACKQPRKADVLIQARAASSANVHSIVTSSITASSSTHEVPIIRQEASSARASAAATETAFSASVSAVSTTHAAVTVPVSTVTATAATSAIVDDTKLHETPHSIPVIAERVVASPGPSLSFAIEPPSSSEITEEQGPPLSLLSSPVPLASPMTAHVISSPIVSPPPPVPVSRHAVSTPLTMTTTDLFSLRSSEPSVTPHDVGGKTPLSINTPSVDDDPFGFAQIALDGLEFVSPPAKIITTTTSSTAVESSRNDLDDPFAIFSNQDR